MDYTNLHRRTLASERSVERVRASLRVATFAFATLGLAGALTQAQAPAAAPATAPAPAAPTQAAAPTAAASATPGQFAVRITGTVQADGIPVPGATVTVTDPASGKARVITTDDRGEFVVTVGHPGEFDVSADMSAFAQAQAQATVPATSGAELPPLSLSLQLATSTPAVTPHPTAAAPQVAGRGTAPAGGSASSNGTQTANASGRGGNGRGYGGGGGYGNFQSLQLSQTGDDADLGDNSAAAADSGVAGMNDSAATDSAIVSGNATQDASALNANTLNALIAADNAIDAGGGPGGPGGLGGPGGPGGFGGPGGGRGGPGGGFGGRGGPGGGFGGRGGPGGFGGGGRGGRGGFNLRQMANRFNQPHGNFSWTFGNSALDALPDSITGTSATTAPPNATQNRYSATFTTPLIIPHIYSDKGGLTNLTVAYFGTHNSNLSDVNALVPTTAERSGDFQNVTDSSGAPVIVDEPGTTTEYPADSVPVSPTAAALLAYFPTPIPNSSGRYNYANTIDSLTDSNNISIRLNHAFQSPLNSFQNGRFNPGRNLSFSLDYQSENNTTPGTFYPYAENLGSGDGINASINYTQPVIGWLNNFSVSFNRSLNRADNMYSGVTDVDAAAGITGVDTNSSTWGLPSLSFTTSGLTSLPGSAFNYTRSNTTSVSDAMIRRLGKHNIRWGGDFRWLSQNPETESEPNGDFTFTGAYTGYDFADFLLGDAYETAEKYGAGVFYFHQDEPDLYFTDNWQASGAFTVQYGIRWEYISPYTEVYNRMTNLEVGPDFSTVTPVVAGTDGASNSVISPDYDHFRPSVGFAWKTLGNAIVRGGFGMAYNTQAYQGIVTALAYQAPFITSESNIATTTTPLSLTDGFGGASTATDIYGVNPNYDVGYFYLGNLDIQRQFGAYVINVDYNANRGLHLDQLRAPNRTADGLLYPDEQPFLYDTTGGQSWFNGGTFIVSRRLSHSVSFRASYEWSKMEDDASQIGGGGGLGGTIAQNDLNLDGEWALSNANVTNRLSASYEWELPYGLNHKWGDQSSFMSSALGDWIMSGSLTASSGSPFTPTDDELESTTEGLQALGVTAPLRVDAVAGVSPYLSSPTLTSYFNTAAFAAPAAGTYGDVGRDSLIGPGSVTLNVSMEKSFRMSEYRSLSIRADANNFLNHPNWSGLDTQFGQTGFGGVTGFGSMRSVSFTTRYRF